uniref:Tyrosine-protein kinase n=1 Tax=Ascaris suum TaxID=6253 RepID=F1L0I7_ASCSU
MSTVSSAYEIPKDVEECDFYHGLLPREDLSYLLKEVGDFLLRTSQPKPTDSRELVLSVRVSTDDKDPLSTRHIVVRKKMKKDGVPKWYAFCAVGYSTVLELVNSYLANKQPVNPEVSSSVLVRAIARQPWEFLHESIKVKDVLGEGQFGEVRDGELIVKDSKLTVAVKLAKAAKEGAQQERAKEKVKEMMHEARLMRFFNHPNVIKIHGVAVCREPLMIVIEKVDGGSLVEVLTKRRPGQVDEDEKIANMSLGAAKGLEYIHSQKCIHRDIAARNVLYTTSKVAKISDFGMSRKGVLYEMSKGSKKIPMKWTAPETIAAYMYTPKTDVFSFSILLWEIFSDGAEPYKGKTAIEVRRMVSCGERLQQPDGCPADMYELMQKCWGQSPTQRLAMNEVVTYIETVLSQESEVPQTPVKKDGVEEESSDNISSKKSIKKRRNKKYRGYKKRASTRRRHRGKAYQKDSKEASDESDHKRLSGRNLARSSRKHRPKRKRENG